MGPRPVERSGGSDFAKLRRFCRLLPFVDHFRRVLGICCHFFSAFVVFLVHVPNFSDFSGFWGILWDTASLLYCILTIFDHFLSFLAILGPFWGKKRGGFAECPPPPKSRVRSGVAPIV